MTACCRVWRRSGTASPGMPRSGRLRIGSFWQTKRAALLWVALGDSMSQGVGASTFEMGWVNQAAPALIEAELIGGVVNLSATGAATRDVLDRQLPELDRLRSSTSLVTLVVGANDMMRRSVRLGLEDRFRLILAALPRGSVVGPSSPARAGGAPGQRADRGRRGRAWTGLGGHALLVSPAQWSTGSGPLPPQRSGISTDRFQFLERMLHR